MNTFKGRVLSWHSFIKREGLTIYKVASFASGSVIDDEPCARGLVVDPGSFLHGGALRVVAPLDDLSASARDGSRPGEAETGASSGGTTHERGGERNGNGDSPPYSCGSGDGPLRDDFSVRDGSDAGADVDSAGAGGGGAHTSAAARTLTEMGHRGTFLVLLPTETAVHSETSTRFSETLWSHNSFRGGRGERDANSVLTA